jgi:hypothetical protein
MVDAGPSFRQPAAKIESMPESVIDVLFLTIF